jgi:hypothetical protein
VVEIVPRRRMHLYGWSPENNTKNCSWQVED